MAPRCGAKQHEEWTLQSPRHGFDAEALYQIALPNVLIIFEGHAAFLSGENFLHLVLETLEGRKLAFVDHYIVPDQAHIGAAFHTALRDTAARHFADLGDVEHLQDFRIAEDPP